MRYLLIVFILLLPIKLLSRNPYILNIDKQDYGAANKNWSIKEDEKGFIYVANDDGLLEFDGVKWTLYILPNKQPVKSLCVQNHNTIYSGNGDCFGKWERDKSGKLIYKDLSSEMPPDDILHSDFWQTWSFEGNIYFQSFHSIYRYKDGKIERVKTNMAILFLLPAGNDLFFQEMKGELYRIKGLRVERLKGTELIKNTDVRVILPYGNNQYIIGTSNSGLFLYDGEKLTKWVSPISERVEREELNCAVLKSDGNFLFGTILAGIFEVNKKGEILNHFSTDKQLRNNTILSLFESKFGSIWVGYDSGIGHMQYWDNIDYYPIEQNNIGAVYAAVLWGENLLLCTNQGVFYINYQRFLKTKSLTSMKLVDKTQGQAWNLSIIDGHLFCSHNRGIIEITHNLEAKIFSKDKNGVFSLAKQKIEGEEVMIASTYHKAVIIKGDSLIYVGMNNIPVKYTLTDHLNNLWLKTQHKGVYKFRLDQQFQAIDTIYFGGNSALDNSVDINMMQVGDRIVFSGDSLFYTYDEINNKIELNSTLNNNIKSIKNIRNIVSQKQHYYWIITSESVYQLYYNGYEAKILDQFNLKSFGLSLVERLENVSILNDSLSMICLDNGFLIHTTKPTVNQYFLTSPSILGISGTDSDGNNVSYSFDEGEKLKAVFDAPYGNLLEIKLFNPNFFYKKESFQYKLLSINEEWITLDNSNTISFQRLPAGSYDLCIRMVDQFGNYSHVVTLSITINKPFYRTFIALFLYLILLILLLVCVWKIVLRHYRNKHLQKIRKREQNRLQSLNEELERKIYEANSELFIRSNTILQRDKLFGEVKEIIQSEFNGKDNKVAYGLYKKLTDLLGGVENNEDQWGMILMTFEQKHPGFFMKLKTISSEITPSDLKICMCLRLNYDSKEIAQMLNLSIRTVDNNRSKLRAKLMVPRNIHLTDFLISI